MQIRAQKGFTLIELMIVIAIIGILAAVAVPQYGQYTKRAKFADVVTQAAALKIAVTLCYQDRNVIADCDGGQYGIPANVNPNEPVLSSITVTDGIIYAVGGVQVDNHTYNLNPLVNGVGQPMNWVVGGQSTCVNANLCVGS